VKTLALIARKPGTTRDAFRAHYEEVHAPLGLTVMSGLVRYVRHHVCEELHGAGGFDVVTSFTYRDATSLHDVFARLATAAGEAVRRDELTFMDKPRNRFFAVREAAERGARDRSAPLQCIALWRRAPGQGAEAFAARALPALHAAVRGLRWSLHNEALATFGEPPWDAVAQLHAAADAGLAAWCAEREREGARVVLVRVTEHETTLPAG
jgi:hypothetical protein